MAKSERYSNLLPYHIIVAAASGDVDAINTVLKHYEGYIAVLATRTVSLIESPTTGNGSTGSNR